MAERPEWMDALQFQNACDMRELARYREREPLVQTLLEECTWITPDEHSSAMPVEDMRIAEQAVRDFKVTE